MLSNISISSVGESSVSKAAGEGVNADVDNLYKTNLVSREIFDSSEFERAAFALATVRKCLNKLPNSVAVSSGQTALIRQLDQKCNLLTDYLVKKIRSRLCSMFSDDNRPGE